MVYSLFDLYNAFMPPQRPSKHEALQPVTDFIQYRNACESENDAYRPVGILDIESFDAALLDGRTFTVRTVYGVLPALVPIEYSDGYDIERVKRLTGTDDVLLLAIPPSLVDADIEIGEKTAVLVEYASSRDVENRHTLSSHIRTKSGLVEVKEFIDPRIEEPDHRAAYMDLYAGKSKNDISGDPDISGDIKAAFNKEDHELLPQDGLTLLNAEDLIANPNVAEELWILFKDRFEWLGDYHPVSMEDTREVFDKIIYSPNTFTPAKFVDGNLVCAGLIMHDISEVAWFTEETVESMVKLAGEDHAPMYFFGIAAKEDSGALHNMQEVVQFHCDLAANAGLQYLVLFESTNMSSMYIPRVTSDYVNSSKHVRFEEQLAEVRKLNYWFLRQV